MSLDLDDFLVVEITAAIAMDAVRLLQKRELRAADSLQLASCLALRNLLQAPCLFICHDSRLAAAAREEGMPTTP